MSNVTGSAGSARQTGLLKIISICTIDLKDDLLFFFLDLKPYVLHSIHTDTAAQRDRNRISCVCLEMKQSLGDIKLIRLTLTH